MSDEKVVMVSGANRGIGGSVAKLLYDSGYRLSLGIRRSSEIERLGQIYDEEQVLTVPYEATDAASPTFWAEATVRRFGRIDALVNSAGIWRRFNFLEDTEDALDELLLVNLKAPMRLMKAAMPYLQQTGRGRVVNLVSLSGLRVAGISAGYAISKFGLLALTYSARLGCWESGVRATAICPGFVNTDMVSGLGSIAPEDMTQPEDVAALVKLAIEMPNNASISMIPVNSRPEPSF